MIVKEDEFSVLINDESSDEKLVEEEFTHLSLGNTGVMDSAATIIISEGTLSDISDLHEYELQLSSLIAPSTTTTPPATTCFQRVIRMCRHGQQGGDGHGGKWRSQRSRRSTHTHLITIPEEEGEQDEYEETETDETTEQTRQNGQQESRRT